MVVREVVVVVFLYGTAALRLGACLRPAVAREWGLSARWLDRVLTCTLAAIVLVRFVVCLNYVSSASMEPTLKGHDVFLNNRLAYRFSRPCRGDLVTFWEPRYGIVVKRVVAIEGDEVAIVGRRLMINGEPISEDYIKPGGADCPARWVRPGCVFVLGDNRGRSADSRFLGDVPESAVVGRVGWRIWPLGRVGMPH